MGDTATSIETWQIDRVREAEDNPRVHTGEQVDMIARSIREFGWVIPLLVTEDGEIVAGHGRFYAARQLGETHVPVMVCRGWTEEQVRAYRVLDNRLTELSDWNKDALAGYVDVVTGAGFDWSDLGLPDVGTVDDLVPPPDDEEVEAPRFDELGEEWGRDGQRMVTCPNCGHAFQRED